MKRRGKSIPRRMVFDREQSLSVVGSSAGSSGSSGNSSASTDASSLSGYVADDFELDLGVPTSSGYALASDIDGVRSWINILEVNLAGFSAGVGGTVTESDSIRTGLQKLEYRVALDDAKVSFPGFGVTEGTACEGDDARLSDSRTPLAHNQASTTISDSTAAGRAILTAADAAAQRSAMGAGTSSLELGETAATAYRGDRGKTAYDHSQITSGNPHGTTPAQIGAPSGSGTCSGNNTGDQTLSGLGGVPLTRKITSAIDLSADRNLTAADVGADASGSAAAVQTNLNAHTSATGNPHSMPAATDSVSGYMTAADHTSLTADTAHAATRSGNPHAVTKSDVGLGNVENTALSTWAGSTNLTTLGTITTGTWHGSAIGDTYISSAANWNAAYTHSQATTGKPHGDAYAVPNASTTGSAGSVKSPTTTGLVQFSGMSAGNTRVKTVSDANDTIAECGRANLFTGVNTFQSGQTIFEDNHTALTTKSARLQVTAYDVSQVQMTAIYATSTSSANILCLGGGTSGGQAATNGRLYASGSQNTTLGTQIAHWDTNGFAVDSGCLVLNNGLKLKRTTISNANSTGAETDIYVVQIGTMSAPRTHTLPAASSLKAGQPIAYKDESGTVSATNTWTLAAVGSDTIEGAASLVISEAYGGCTLVSNGVDKYTRWRA